ncbi:hypothetical protein [Limnofasciculus baicalensis]|uniref:Uncharacterized protein n=1 Tax=Limnofasciculus baicalensis BBK-W-15 TaxID=2699891 RepID=A0AAE3GP63_9CYAN|nr:hypothetical protein [Limnofasciculus baicalensis]MCP2727263.1 hypothetical protein [Limnofasciculus baicalensis BBK-W-15]
MNWKIFSLKSQSELYQDNLTQFQEQIASNLPAYFLLLTQLNFLWLSFQLIAIPLSPSYGNY